LNSLTFGVGLRSSSWLKSGRPAMSYTSILAPSGQHLLRGAQRGLVVRIFAKTTGDAQDRDLIGHGLSWE